MRHSVSVGLAFAFALLVVLAAAPAFAALPSVTDTSGPAFGRSAWTYRDLSDSAAKYEGGYARFDDTSTATYTDSPHGGYSTVGSKCKTCHAVHRAEASYQLLRADTQADVCTYCHLGSAHSSVTVYDANADGMATTVGHSIGAPARIPLSSTFMSVVTTSLPITDSAGITTTETITIRSVDSSENALFRLSLTHGQSMPSVGRYGYERTGPVPLTCMSCHQVHNAVGDIWQPMAYPDHDTTLSAGYKLLRKRPSGSIHGPDDQPYDNGVPGFTVSYTRDGMQGAKSYDDFRSTGLVDVGNTIAVPETTLVAGVYGDGKTTWDSPAWQNSTYFDSVSSGVPTPGVDVRGVDQYALSVWCADCHNLAIGSFEATGPVELGVSSHGAARTHTVPFSGAGNGPAQCYTCHRADLTPEPTSTAFGSDPACERCHYGTGAYANDVVRTSAAGSDFPHSGAANGEYLLGAWSVDAAGSVVATNVTEANAADAVCVRCHVASGDTHNHRSTVASNTITGSLTATYTTAQGAVMTYGGQGCGQCHYADIKVEHAKPTTSGERDCSTCHGATEPPASWNESCLQAGCHATYHADMATKHAQTAIASCSNGGDAGCHQLWNDMDVAETHADAWKSWTLDPTVTAHPYVGSGTVPKDGCALCHTSARVVPDAIKTDCVDCHTLPHS